jgi:hypothetical protein
MIPLDTRMKISMKRNLKVGADARISSYDFLNCFSNDESGIDSRVIVMNIMIVIAPQKKAITIASFRLIS